MRALHPYARALLLALFAVGTFSTQSVRVLALGWMLLLFLMAQGGVVATHLRFVARFMLPVLVGLFVIWGWLVGAPPSLPMHSDPSGGVRFAALTGLRLIVLGGAFQFVFLTIPPALLATTFYRWGLRGQLLLIALGSYTLFEELGLRVDQVVAARYASGAVPSRSLINRMRQLPFVLRPLTTWTLRSAIQRGDVWADRQMARRLPALAARTPLPRFRFIDVTVSAVAVTWLFLAVFS